MLRPGDTIDHRFHLLREAGAGGMGVTFVATDTETAGTVVIKVPQLPGTDSLDEHVRGRVIGRFNREAGVLAMMTDHPTIPKVVRRGWHGSIPYIAMSYINGSTVEKWRYLTPQLAELAAVGTSISRTLRAVHAKDVLHRDLKPVNIMISNSGQVYVIDFGIALPLVGDPTRYTRSFVGTDEYTAPECYQRDAKEESDLYSLGCVLYFLLTGRPPFVQLPESTRTVQTQHTEDTPIPPSQRGARVPRAVEETVLALLAKDARDRPDIGAVLAALEPHLPAVGSPEPSPRLDPDVTLPFRDPTSGRPAEAEAPRQTKAARPFVAGPTRAFLTPDDIEEGIRAAVTQERSGDAAAATTILTELRVKATKAYGRGHRHVRPIEDALERLGQQG
ncbi:serine/threonine-protein kinase [Actinokineospora inagensis]|uniref:serine/threonine-protein kinase n=1 Tax=Actinokineospora inagensis TaxID=103730 RepID=UPI00041B05EC|nr:serine/threonine-protein kinase [Actinokineospora inagensis]